MLAPVARRHPYWDMSAKALPREHARLALCHVELTAVLRGTDELELPTQAHRLLGREREVERAGLVSIQVLADLRSDSGDDRLTRPASAPLIRARLSRRRSGEGTRRCCSD
jgi:hypothetical protein